MGVGPAVAIPAAVKSASLELGDIDLFKINEAFASQFVYCHKKLETDPEKINVNGGAMAIGHPLGATGARCDATLLHEMKGRSKDCRFGVVSMCAGMVKTSELQDFKRVAELETKSWEKKAIEKGAIAADLQTRLNQVKNNKVKIILLGLNHNANALKFQSSMFGIDVPVDSFSLQLSECTMS